MAGDGTEIARAYVTIVPKSDGRFGAEIEKTLGGLGKVGDEQGTKAGKSFATKFAAFGSKGADALKKGLAVGFTAAGAGAVAFAKSSIDAGRQFDASMSQVAATMGKSVDEIGDLRDFAQDMGAKTAFSASQAADALNYMALAGYDADTSMKMLPNVLNLAAAGGMDLATASDMVTDTQSALGLSLDETTALVDKMAAASSKTNTSVSQLGSAFLTVGGTAKNLSGGTTEAAQALGLLADNGIKGSEGGTALRNVLLGLSSDKFAKSFGEMGVAVYDTEGNMRSLKDIFGDMNTAMEGMTVEEKTEAISSAFNKVDLKSVNALLATDAERWDEVAAAIDNSAGAAQAMADTQQDNLEGDINKLGAAVEGLQIAFSDALTPALRDFVQWGTEGIGQVTEYLKTDEFKSFAEGALGAVKTGIEGVAGAIQFLAQNGQTVLPIVTGLGMAFASFKVVTGIVGAITSIGAILPAMGAGGAAAAGGLTATAGAETAAGTAAGAAAGNMLRMGAAVLMIGAGVALAAVGVSLLAQSAIALADNGNGAVTVMLGLGVGIAALIGVAALAGGALTAGAVGMLAFGAAVLLVGAGVAIASAGITLLATQLPTIAAYGMPAAACITMLGAGLLVMGAGALVAGAGLLVMAPGLIVATAAMVAFAPAMGLVAAGAAALGGALTLIAGAVMDVGTGAKNMGDGLASAANAMPAIASNAVPAGQGIIALADSMNRAREELASGSQAMAQAGEGALALATGVLATAGGASTAAAAFKSMAQNASLIGTGMRGATMTAAALSRTISTLGSGSAQSLRGVSTAANSAKASISTFGTNGGKSIGDISTAAKNLSTAMTKLASDVSSAMKSASDSVSKAADSMKSSIDKIPSTKTITVTTAKGHVWYPSWSTPDIKPGQTTTSSVSWHQLAEGGILTRPVFVAGEAGPEAVLPLSRLENMLDESNERALGAGGVSITVNARTDADANEIAYTVARRLSQLRKAGAYA